LKKNQDWIWDEECEAAFESLKKAVMKEPMLRLPDVTMPFELHTDASDFAIGGVLMQDGHLIAFESQKLNEMERKYTVQEKEMTPVVHCLRFWRHYLLGSRFVIKTDNIATSYFQTQKKLSPKQARWQDFLAEFDYQFEYKPGKANEGLEHDPLAKKIIALAKDSKARRFWLKGDMLFTKGDRLYVPKWGKWGDLRRIILKDYHDSKWAGHPGIKRTLALVEGTYYWPRMEDDVETFVRTADDTIKLFFKNVVKYWGVPNLIVSDRDPRFTGRFWKDLFKIMRMDLNFSTSFHPQTDGQTKRVNALLELYLRHYVSANQHDWAKLLDVA
nr:reverse transcriptase [Tanacetum cinerariifolium]